MAALLEDKTKELLARQGLAIPAGISVSEASGLARAQERVGFPAVVKALIPIGKKGKAGAVRMVDDAAALRMAFDTIVGSSYYGFEAQAVLVERREAIEEELFLSITFDSLARGAMMVIGRLGGVDVEDAAAEHGGAFARRPFDVDAPLDDESLVEHWRSVGLNADAAHSAARATAQALAAFVKYDARMLEINPLGVMRDGRCVAIGTLMDIDDDALFRQTELGDCVQYGSSRMGRPATALERRLLDLDAASQSGSVRFMELDGGDIGCLLSGGGCSLWSTDHVIDCGGKPATYYDATTPSEEILHVLITGVISMPGVRGLIFGSNIINFARIDARVRLVVDIIESIGLDLQKFPVVMRMAGAGEDDARKAAARLPHLEYYGAEVTLEYALDRIVARVNEIKSGDLAA